MSTRTKDAEYDLPISLQTLRTGVTQQQVASWADITECRNGGVLWSSTEGHLQVEKQTLGGTCAGVRVSTELCSQEVWASQDPAQSSPSTSLGFFPSSGLTGKAEQVDSGGFPCGSHCYLRPKYFESSKEKDFLEKGGKAPATC